MRSLVTGASGHLGSYLVRRLLREGAEVFALVRPDSDLWRLADVLDRIEVIRADLSDVKRIQSSITEAKPEATFHLAWQGVTSGFKNDARQITLNVAGSLDLFEIIRTTGCKLWVGVGSQAEYGTHNEILTEETPVRPETAYGVAKLSLGLLTQKLCELSGIRFIWLRLLATYGPKDDERHLIPSVIRHLLAGESPQLTSGEQKWDYLYVADAADAIYRAAVRESAHGVFNLSSGEAHTVRKLVEQIRNIIDPSLPLGFGEIPTLADQIMHLQADISKLREATGWTPQTSLEEGLKRTIEWSREAAGVARL
ncbi:MAG TPA: NAD-dependent epimerase/dehydratase family protein [Pyrinomonadaceae bacterium]|nr:NAD-dependent epimerase/dehydratase family protein [Pyrinomonadaceae bacterium]